MLGHEVALPPSPPRVPGSAVTANADADAPPRSGLKARAVTEAEPEPAEPKAKLRKVRDATKTRSRRKRAPRYRFDSISFIVTETSSFVHAYSTHAHRAYIFHILFLYYCFSFVVVDYNIAHRTLYSLVHL